MSSFALSGEFFAFCTTLCWSIGIFPFTEASRRMGANSVNHFRLLLAVILLTFILPFFFSLSFSALFFVPQWQHWLWLGLSGAIGLSLGDYFGFTSFVILGARVGSIFGTLAPGAALIAGYIMMGETINMVGVIGMLITIAGIVWLSFKKTAGTHSQHGSFKKGILYGLLAAICQGLGLVLARKGMNTEANNILLNPIHASWIRMVIGTTVIFLFSGLQNRLMLTLKPVIQNKNNGLSFAIAGTLFGPVAGLSFAMYSISLINTSVAQTIFSLVPVFALPLSYVFHKEKITIASLNGALIAVLGVIILIWREAITSFFSF